MINLLPPKGHTSLKHEYFLRIISVYGFMLGAVFISGIILVLPTYVLVSSQLNNVRPMDSEEEIIKNTYAEALSHIQDANTVMAQLRSAVPNVETSAIITEVIRLAPKGITFHTFQAKREANVLKSIDVQGYAVTRNALAALKNALEASPIFETATVPISDLARETNLPFVITITLSDSNSTE